MHAQNAKASGNGVITGKVVDSATNSPLEYTTISLYKKGNSRPLDGTMTNKSGHFQLINAAPGSYTVVVEFIGYKNLSLPVTINNNASVVDLKTIGLNKTVSSLQNVTVTTETKVFENRIDRMVFNAEKDLTSQTGVATDVLKKIPQVSVDADGNVELAGSTSVRFLINGKPSTSLGNNIADVLQSIPASQIKSIEVITNPGAKYDAEGIGGIINIILKKNTGRGINGNLSLTAGTLTENGSFNFNAKKGKIGFNAYISGSFRPYSTVSSTYDRVSSDSNGNKVLLHENGKARYKRHGYESGVGIDYTINDKNSLSALLTYDNYAYLNNNSINQTQTTTNPVSGTQLSSVSVLNNVTNSFNFYNIAGSVDYRKMFAKEGEELYVSFITGVGKNLGGAGNLQNYISPDSLYYGTNSTNPSTQKESELAVDYTNPVKKDVILGVGGKINYREILTGSNVLSYQPSVKQFLPNTYLTNSLEYYQKIYALYTELTFPVKKLFDAKIGGRYERTNINADYSNAQPKINIPGYNTFVPSVYFSKGIGENQQIKLSYSKRIERPDYRVLSPFINTSDPKNITAGNPYLNPETGNRYELAYSLNFKKTGSVSITAFYRTSNNTIQGYLVYYPSLKIGDTTYTNVSVNTRKNIGLEKDEGISLFGDLHFFTKLNVRTNFFAFYRRTVNAINIGMNSSSFIYRSNINMNYQFGKNIVAEFFGNFNSKRRDLQVLYPSFFSYSVAIRKQFWNKNGSLALTAINPFAQYVNQTIKLYGVGFNVTSSRQIPFRSFGINFTWKFGTLKYKNRKLDNAPNLNLPTD